MDTVEQICIKSFEWDRCPGRNFLFLYQKTINLNAFFPYICSSIKSNSGLPFLFYHSPNEINGKHKYFKIVSISRQSQRSLRSRTASISKLFLRHNNSKLCTITKRDWSLFNFRLYSLSNIYEIAI